MIHLTDKEIQEHIENNCRNAHGDPMMDEQVFYEGAKWYRDTVVKNNAVLQHVRKRAYNYPYWVQLLGIVSTGYMLTDFIRFLRMFF